MGPNEKALRNAYAGYVRGEPISEMFATDVLWISVGSPNRVDTAGEWHGSEGVAQYFAALAANWTLTEFVVEEVVAQDDRRFAVRIRVKATSVPTGKVVHFEKADLVTMRDGQIVSYNEIYDTAPMIRAARL